MSDEYYSAMSKTEILEELPKLTNWNNAESVREFQPRVAATLGLRSLRILTLKALAKGLSGAFANSFRVRE